MTPGNDAGRRPSRLSRRRLLASIGGVGAVGMASGLGTGAYLSDRETFPGNAFGAGEVELVVDTAISDGTFAVDVSGIGRGPDKRASDSFNVEVRTNPARVWLAAKCPTVNDDLSDALEVDVRVDGSSITGGFRPFATVAAELVDGERIDTGCLDPESPIEVEVFAELPVDAPDSLSGQNTSLSFRLYAEQCRHVSEADAAGSNPFADRVCEEPGDNCPECVEFGKAEFGDSPVAVGDTLSLIELPAGADGHEIAITAVETKDEGGNAETVGVEFTLQDADGNPGPDMCKVEIKGGQETESYEIDPASSETDEILFAPLKPDKDKRHGISNIVVFVCSDSGDGDDPDEDETVDCVVCDDENASLATLDVRYRGDDEPSVTVVSTKGGTGGTLFEGTVANGDVFTLDGSDVTRSGNNGNGNGGGQTDRLGPEVEIRVEGGATTPIHVSCSELLAVGMRFGPDDEFEIAGGTTTDERPICGTEAN
ncbi:SipW-dependent-type signal peptide-containing protein [Halorubrum sp. Ea8]|uniref:DUF7467 domain-containing protein n=1 Tax=Halorubrum sp. Ea8 TaxID=1383841 RepID=UPI000B980A64|nr:SipW-dependent-type signal peptide-containing protein [Halorubrum sp. Ea8]OYR46819.1 hypothetical protein DJ74_14245 [Halorubrum sp. Ea8]